MKDTNKIISVVKKRPELKGYLEVKIDKLIVHLEVGIKERLGLWSGNCEPLKNTEN